MFARDVESKAAEPSVPWANASLATDPGAVLKAIEKDLTVSLIATDRSLFETCSIDEKLTSVMERNRQMGFDYLPVTKSSANDAVVGLIELAPLMKSVVATGQRVREKMCPLSEENLIGADASILDFLRGADSHQCRLVISGSS